METQDRKVESVTETKEQLMATLGLSPSEEQEQTSDSAETAEETIEESETSNTDEDADEVTEDKEEKKEKPKKFGGYQKKLNKMTAKNYALMQRIQELEAMASSTKEPQKAVSKLEEPKAENFDSHAEYLRAVVKYENAVIKEEQNKEESEKSAKSVAKAKDDAFNTKVAEFVKLKPDYVEVLNNCDVDVKQGLIELIKDSEIGPRLGYELAKDEDELERINSLPPRQAAIELLKFEAKLTSSSEKQTKEVKTTQAARPLKPVGSASKANLNDSPYEKDMTYQEFKEWEAKQKKK